MEEEAGECSGKICLPGAVAGARLLAPGDLKSAWVGLCSGSRDICVSCGKSGGGINTHRWQHLAF